ncbi:hypothetical protein RHMOL_Rhmol03G0110600 [Rhododendron molle]|uniref:Uncharacterized protein n=1 Tax=Rhododendron molle TaxID=49168 RepID=A0ACC0PF81_RHOML|nr:hypothetical protein RHMOL_Rhmol03G0110600 [Rhododendron molle]
MKKCSSSHTLISFENNNIINLCLMAVGDDDEVYLDLISFKELQDNFDELQLSFNDLNDESLKLAITNSRLKKQGGGGDSNQGREQEAAGGEEHRAVEPEPRAMDEAGAVGPRVDPEGPSATVEGSPAVGGSDVVSDSATVEDDTGPNESPPRGSDKGKGIAVEEEQTTKNVTVEIREENIAFRPPVTATTSSSHMPITFDDIAEHTPDEILAKLLEDNPAIGEYVLKAKKNRARAIEASEATEKAERESRARRVGGGYRGRGEGSRGGTGAEGECSD